jgi:ABC-type transport system involved in cytochrome bd biosynthesis fused ATPase/permease subunit
VTGPRAALRRRAGAGRGARPERGRVRARAAGPAADGTRAGGTAAGGTRAAGPAAGGTRAGGTAASGTRAGGAGAGIAPAAVVRRVAGLAGPDRGRFAAGIGLGLLAAGSAVALMAAAAWLISAAALRPELFTLTAAIVGVRAFAIGRAGFRYAERLVSHDVAFRLLARIRVRVYRHLEPLAPAGLPAFRRGDLLSRLVADVDTIQDLPLRVVQPAAVAAVAGAASVGLAAALLPAAGAVLVAALLAAALAVPAVAAWAGRRADARLAGARAELAAGVVELLRAQPDLVAYGAAGQRLAAIEARDAELTRLARTTAAASGLAAGLAALCGGLAAWGSLAVGIPAVRSGALDGVALAVVVLVPLAAFEIVQPLPTALAALARVRRGGARVLAVLDTPAPVPEPAAPLPLPTGVAWTVRLRGVRARWPAPGDPDGAADRPAAVDGPATGAGTGGPRRRGGADRPMDGTDRPADGADRPAAVDGVDLDLAPGRRVAVVGASGAGKTTLAAVLLRFVEADGGTYELGGADVRRLAGDDVRRVVGLCAQDAHVFDSTVRENLRLARPEADDAALRAALAGARLLAWVDGLPAGMDTFVGERGALMSAGQRQRLALARALLAGFPVLVLDEPAANLDPRTADALTRDLLAAGAGRPATLLITHRLALLDRVDEVVVLDAGRVVERGTHRQLLRAGGRYRMLWDLERSADPG